MSVSILVGEGPFHYYFVAKYKRGFGVEVAVRYFRHHVDVRTEKHEVAPVGANHAP